MTESTSCLLFLSSNTARSTQETPLLLTGARGNHPRNLQLMTSLTTTHPHTVLFASVENGRAKHRHRWSGKRCPGQARRDAGQLDLRVEAAGPRDVRAAESPLQVRH